MNYGRYQVVEEIGQGSMGLVYRAHDPQIDRQVALKVLRRDRISGEEFVNRFLKEARVIGRLSHPNIVTVYDVGQEGPDLYIAMEFIEGSPLNDILRVISLSLERIVEIGIQAALTLDYAHQKGVVHRDIKPSNILLQPDKNIIITDFGIAHLEGSTDTLQTREGDIMGTPAYMSPEQVLGQAIDGRADIFSLGAVLYELTTGSRPFGGAKSNIATVFNAIMNQEPQEPAAISGQVDQDLSAVIMKCLRKDPAERYQTGSEVAQALTRCLTKMRTEEAESEPEPESRVQEPPVEKKKKSFIISAALAAVAAILLAAGIYFYVQHMGKAPKETPVKEESIARPQVPPPSAPPVEVKQEPPAAPAPLPQPAPAPAPKPMPVLPSSPEPVKVAPAVKPPAETQKAQPKIPRREEKKAPAVSVPAKPPQKPDSGKRLAIQKDVTPAVFLTPVRVLSNPPGAQAFVDEKLKGTTPVTLMLPVGKHNVRIVLPGYREARKQVTVEETMEYPVSFQLKSAGESD